MAIVHDWLVDFGGAERVLAQIIKVFPHADLFALIDFFNDEQRASIGGKKARTSFLQHVPGARRVYRNFLPLMPLAVEQLDVTGYDMVISSSHAVAKGVLTGPDQVHVCYIHSPIRYAWDLQHQYLRAAGLERGFKAWVVRWQLHKIRLWDTRTALGVDQFVANSEFIARRVRKVYRREAEVVYPPVNVNVVAKDQVDKENGYFVTASRMVPYKRMDLIVEAFTGMPDLRLVVVGDGPEMGRIRAIAGSNVTVTGHVSYSEVRDYMCGARAFVFAAEEDFGIAMVEALAAGTPLIAYGRGGAKEIVSDGSRAPRTGVFFEQQTVESLQDAVRTFIRYEDSCRRVDCVASAKRFSEQRFREDFLAATQRAWDAFSPSPKEVCGVDVNY